MDCHSLLQGIFLTQESNWGLPHCMSDSLPSEPPGKSVYTKELWYLHGSVALHCILLLLLSLSVVYLFLLSHAFSANKWDSIFLQFQVTMTLSLKDTFPIMTYLLLPTSSVLYCSFHILLAAWFLVCFTIHFWRGTQIDLTQAFLGSHAIIL